jgi:hypothetical protein
VIVPKHILSVGSYFTPDGVLKVNDGDLSHWHNLGNRMVAAGVPIPVPLDHQDNAKLGLDDVRAERVRNNGGWVDGYFISGNELWANLNIADDDIAKKVSSGAVRWVSPQIRKAYMTGDGTVWQNCISHIALCNVPRFQDQKPFGTEPTNKQAVSLSVYSTLTLSGDFSLSLSEFLGQEQVLSDKMNGERTARQILGHSFRVRRGSGIFKTG